MAAAPPDGQEKVIAAAQHIVKSLANSKNAADDMIRILSGFDNRLSLMSDLFPPPPNAVAAAPESILEDEASGGEEREEPDPDDAARDEERDAAVEEAVRVVERWESPAAGDRLVFDSSEDAEEYLDAAAALVGATGARAEAALQAAMVRLEEEFRHLLIRGTSPLAAEDLHASLLRRLSLTVPSFSSSASDLDCPSFANHAGDGDESGGAGGRTSVSDDEISPYLITQDTVSALRDIAGVMLRAGYAPELCQVYGEVRRDTLMECLAVLGVDKMSLEEVQRVEWGVLDVKMKKWIQALKVVVRGLLAEERRICSQILSTDADAEEVCFTEAAKGCVLQLLNFGDAIAIGKRSSEKLFRILGMYEALAEVLPELEGLFSGEASDFIKEEAEGILIRLGDAVRGTVAEFANAIQGETSRRPLPGGEIHPLTRYVMNYVRLLADYSRSLNRLLDDWETELESGGENANTTPLGHCVLILISHLQSKIEEKAKLYEDEALQNIFLMNNLLYIVQKVKDSELKTLLGDNWIRKRRGQIRRYSTGYLRSSWTRVLACLRDDGLPQTMGSSSALKAALKERFKNFNLAFEELYRTQTAWRVVDPQLREELKISISEKVLPAYRSFLGRFQGQLEGGRSSAKYIKYNPEDLENQVSDLFEGRRINA